MARYSRRKFLAVGGTSVGVGLVGYQTDAYTRARIASLLSPLPGIRATGKPLTVRQHVEDKNVEYLPETDEVRFATGRNEEGPTGFVTRSFEWWAEFEAASIASRTVYQHLPSRVGTDDLSSGVSSKDDRVYVTVAPTGPSIARKELVAKSPNHVTVTVVFAGKEYTTDIPVIVGKRREIHAT